MATQSHDPELVERQRPKSDQAVIPSSPSNVLIFSGLPPDFFLHPRLAHALLDLLNAYGPLRRYVPLPAHGRAIVVYAHADSAGTAKAKLDHLLLPFDGHSAQSLHGTGPAAMRVYFGQPGDELVWAPVDSDQHLHVPPSEKNFLISPPGSPPIGWEPSKEQAPGKDTLADDLVAALTRLSGGELEQEAQEEPEPSTQVPVWEAQAPLELQPPSAALTLAIPESDKAQLVVPPSQDIPGVSIETADGDDAPHTKGPTIAEVKAAVGDVYAAHTVPTVDVPVTVPAPSITAPELGFALDQAGAADHDLAACTRIMPTARPPLELMDPSD